MKKNKGSILVSTVMILSVVMITVLSFVFISNIERQAATSSNDSLVAFQRADTGIENTLRIIVEGYTNNINDSFIASSWTGTDIICNPPTAPLGRRGTIQLTEPDGIGYLVQLYKYNTATPPILVAAPCYNPGPVVSRVKYSEIVRIKSVGLLSGKASRAVSADVPRTALLLARDRANEGITNMATIYNENGSALIGGYPWGDSRPADPTNEIPKIDGMACGGDGFLRKISDPNYYKVGLYKGAAVNPPNFINCNSPMPVTLKLSDIKFITSEGQASKKSCLKMTISTGRVDPVNCIP